MTMPPNIRMNTDAIQRLKVAYADAPKPSRGIDRDSAI